MIKYLLLFLFATNSFAATTASVTLSGSVPAATAIVVNPVSPYNNLDLTTTQTNLLVANVREINNTTLGYIVRVSSLNAGALKNGPTNSIAYTAKYNGVTFNLTVAPVTVTTQGTQTSVINIVKPLTISYTGQPSENQFNGSYSDTLTFTIIAN